MKQDAENVIILMNRNLLDNSIVKSLSDINFDTAIILGSGFKKILNYFKIISTFNYLNLNQKDKIKGHSLKLHHIKIHNKNILIFEGRLHLYQGLSFNECVYPIKVLQKLNCRNLILTNSSGAINNKLSPGDIVLINSFIGFWFYNKIFNSMKIAHTHQTVYPSQLLKNRFLEAAKSVNLNVNTRNYFFTSGPSYETPAEIRMMKTAGADLVGMSTLPEVFYATNNNFNVLSISSVSNMASDITKQKLTHKEVIRTTEKSTKNFVKIFKNFFS